jgi:hypothetical protein
MASSATSKTSRSGSGATVAGVVVEIDGMLWRPKTRSRSSADELREARRVWHEIHEDARWNPWVEDERAVERERAMRVMAE